MVREVYGVHLSAQEKGRLKKMIRPGRSSAQAVTRARILLKTDEGWTAARVAAAFDVSERTARRAKRRYCQRQLKIERFRQLRIDPLVVGGKFRQPRIDPPPFSCSAKMSVV